MWSRLACFLIFHIDGYSLYKKWNLSFYWPQVLQSKCLRLVTGAPWYLSNRQILEDLGVPLLADHIRALTESFDSKLADAGNPSVRQLGRYLLWPRVGPVARRANRRRRVPADQSRPPLVDGQVDQTDRARR